MNDPYKINSPELFYKKGDFIGQAYEVYDVLGVGGFGVVYLVYSHDLKSVYALKTLRDEYLEDDQTRERFRKEAKVWIDLERHPFLVKAFFVEEISGRVFIGLEYIAPDQQGLNSLDGYLLRQPPDIAQSLRWAIQVCYGMEYAYSRGIKAHRDIKPTNIMMGQDKVIKISDFGLAGVIFTSKTSKTSAQKNISREAYQTMEGTAFGTPPYMPPEQFKNAAACDERSDLYSFGIVLYQMVSGGKLPFYPKMSGNNEINVLQSWYMLHSEASIPRINSPLFPLIQRCLEKESHRRYRSFKEMRLELEQLLKRGTGEAFNPPELEELGVSQWSNKGYSLASLRRFDEAILCYNKALEIDPRYPNIWTNKGSSLFSLGRFDEAITCCNKALEIDPRHASAWGNKGLSLDSLRRFDEAILCYKKGLEIDPRYPNIWTNKGSCLYSLRRFDEAILCHNKALEIDPRYTVAWNNKGVCLYSLGRFDESIACYNKALEIDPRQMLGWKNKGYSLHSLRRFDEAILCFNKALEIDPLYTAGWNNKGMCLASLGRLDEAVLCYNKALEIDPRYMVAWTNKGLSFGKLGRFDEAIRCYNKALEKDQNGALTWYYKGLAEKLIDRQRDAIHSFRQFIAHAHGQYSAEVDYARQYLRELEGK